METIQRLRDLARGCNGDVVCILDMILDWIDTLCYQAIPLYEGVETVWHDTWDTIGYS